MSVCYPLWTCKNKKRHSSIMMGKLMEGNYISFAIMEVFSHLWTWNLSTFHSNSWLLILSSNRSTFMSHVTYLIISKNVSVHVTLCPGIFLIKSKLSSICSYRSVFKGKSCWELPSTVKINSMSITFKSVLWLLHTQIPELCSDFCFIDEGFIMALLRWDYACQLQHIF